MLILHKHNTAPRDAQPTGSQKAKRLGVCYMFLGLNAGMKAFRCVVGKHGNCPLDDDWPSVGPLVYEVNRAPCDANTVVQRLFPRIQPRKGWQNGGVYVEDPLWKGGKNATLDYPHKPRKHNDFRPILLQGCDVALLAFAIEFRFVRRAAHELGWDVMPAGSIEDAGVFDVRQDANNCGVQSAGGNSINDGLAVAALSRTKNGDSQRCAHGVIMHDAEIRASLELISQFLFITTSANKIRCFQSASV